MKKLYLNYTNYRDYTHDGKQYGEWSASNDFNFIGLSKEEGTEISIDFDLIDEKLYLVYGVYSTGDSFGHENNVLEFLEYFSTQEEAKAYKEKVELFTEMITFLSDTYGYKPKEKSNKIRNFLYRLGDNVITRNDFGNKYKFVWKGNETYFPWSGYFERLDYISIEELTFLDEEDKY